MACRIPDALFDPCGDMFAGLDDRERRSWCSAPMQTRMTCTPAVGVTPTATTLKKTAELLGRDLDDPGIHAELWLALTAL